jgi:autotransporter-associated beta strand protein
MHKNRRLVAACAAAVTAAGLIPARQASAVVKFWDTSTSANLQAGNGVWDTGSTALWSLVSTGSNPLQTWADNDSATFQTGGTNAVDLNGGTVLVTTITNSVNSTTPGTVTTIGNGTVQFNGATGATVNQANTTGTFTLGANVVARLNAASVNFAVGSGQSLVVNGNVDELGGARALTKSSAGTLNLNGTNSWTGGTGVNGGLVRFGAASTIPTTGTITIGANGTLATAGPAGFTTATNWLASGKIAAASGGAIGLVADEAAINLTGFDNLNLGAATATTFGGTLTPGANGYRFGGFATLTVTSALNAATTLTVNNVNGSTTVLQANNGYTGLTTVNGGSVLRATVGTTGGSSALGTTAAGTVVADTGRLELANNVTITGEALTINGQGNNSQGALHNQSGNNEWAGTVTIGNATARIGVATGVLTVSGAITDGANTFKLTVRNNTSTTGSVLLTNPNNTYDGGTDIVVGVLQLGVDNALPTGTTVLMGNSSGQGTGATLDLNGHAQTIAHATTITSNNITTRVLNGGASAAALTINAPSGSASTAGTTAAPVVFGGPSNTGNNFSITKAGAGTTTFAGASTYAGGTTITGGTLTAGIDGALGTGNVSVADTAVSLAIAAGVTDAIANAATLSLAGGGALNTADAGFANLSAGVNETVAALFLGGIAQPAGTYGAVGSGAGTESNEFFAGSGIVTVGSAVPEPGTLGLAAVAIAGALSRRRRRA